MKWLGSGSKMDQISGFGSKFNVFGPTTLLIPHLIRSGGAVFSPALRSWRPFHTTGGREQEGIRVRFHKSFNKQKLRVWYGMYILLKIIDC